MVCDRKDDNSFGLRPVDERKREILDENPAGTGTVRRTSIEERRVRGQRRLPPLRRNARPVQPLPHCNR